jgi:hypothetical protein
MTIQLILLIFKVIIFHKRLFELLQEKF